MCEVSASTSLEAYIGRRDENVFIEIVIERPIDDVVSVCLDSRDTRELAKTLNDLAERLQKHLEKNQRQQGEES